MGVLQRERANHMGLPLLKIRYTVEEYLALERASEERHEYLDGDVYAMAGESPEHGAICVNLAISIGSQVRGTPCQAFVKDMKVCSGPLALPGRSAKGLFSYPDLVVVCGAMQFHDQFRDVLLNPSLIIEVLSASTEAFDRGEKFRRYRTWLPTLQDYLLIAQDKPFIDHYHRVEENRWELVPREGLDASLHLESVHCTLRLADVYDRIIFPPEDAELAQDQPAGS
jgi:Uma2 family endonuclease